MMKKFLHIFTLWALFSSIILLIFPQALWYLVAIGISLMIPIGWKFWPEWISQYIKFVAQKRAEPYPAVILGNDDHIFMWDGELIRIAFELTDADHVINAVHRETSTPSVRYDTIAQLATICGMRARVNVLTMGSGFDSSDSYLQALKSTIGSHYGFVSAKTIIIIDIPLIDNYDLIKIRGKGDIHDSARAFARIMSSRISYYLHSHKITHRIMDLPRLRTLAKKLDVPETFPWGTSEDYETFAIVDADKFDEYFRIHSDHSNILVQITEKSQAAWLYRIDAKKLAHPTSYGLKHVYGISQDIIHTFHPRTKGTLISGRKLTAYPRIPQAGNGIYLGNRDTANVFLHPLPGGAPISVYADDTHWQTFQHRLTALGLPIETTNTASPRESIIVLDNPTPPTPIHPSKIYFYRLTAPTAADVTFDTKGVISRKPFNPNISLTEASYTSPQGHFVP